MNRLACLLLTLLVFCWLLPRWERDSERGPGE